MAPDLDFLKALEDRIWTANPESFLVVCRKRDEALLRATLPEAHVHRAEGGLSRMQWFEFASMYLGVTAAAVLMGAVHLATGVAVQAIFTLACLVGLILYHRSPKLEKKLLRMGMPDHVAREWESWFDSNFALALLTVPEDDFEAARGLFEESGMQSPLAVDRRLVL
jgi:hypothetical protein